MKRPNTNIGLYFHELSKDISWGGRVRIPKESKDYPKNWIEVEYKTYENVPKIKLLERDLSGEMQGKLTDIILERKSAKDFEGTRKIRIKDLSALINYSIALKSKHGSSRVHPSGGARYSLEYYFLVQKSDELKTGIYHYNVLDHSLEFIKEINQADLPIVSGYEWVKDASVVMFLTSIFDRNMRKYGERGYRYILLEAGHVGQNIYLVSSGLDLPVRAVAGTYDIFIENLLGIDGKIESLVYTLVI